MSARSHQETCRDIDLAAIQMEIAGALVANPPTSSQRVFDHLGYSLESIGLAIKLARTHEDRTAIEYAFIVHASVERERLSLKLTLLANKSPTANTVRED